MSLATRCPACGTIFRVVQDQLKVSEGWVRCGQCHEVFHGIEALFDLESDPAVAARRAARHAAPSPPQVFGPSRAPQAEPEGPAAIVVPTPDAPAPRFAITRPARHAPPDAGPSSGFAPAPTPRPTRATPIAPAPAVRGTIAPRFAARLAEEEARAQAARTAPPPSWQAADAPKAHDPGPPQDFAVTDVQDLATTPMNFDELYPEPPAPHFAQPPMPGSVGAPSAHTDERFGAPEADPAAGTFDAPPARQPRPIVIADDTWPPRPPASKAAPPHDPQADISTMPSRLADDGDADGPPTLSSLLPDIDDWPLKPGQRSRSRRQRRSASAAGTATDPRFLREAQRHARWSRPGVRAALLGALVMLVLAAGAQLAWPLRDTIAARWSWARPALAALCEQAGCTIEPPRAIASLALDGSSLTRTNTEHVLLFSADLHNRADHPVRMPSFDLTFMDLNGQVVARKVLAPQQIGIAQTALAPEAELHVHARIQVGTLDASGFQAEMFYP